MPVCALLLSTLLGCRSTSDAPDMGGEDLPPMINLNADAGAEQPADQPQLAARELPAEIPPQSVEQPASAAAAISSATASAALPNPVEQDTVDPIDDVPPPPGDEPEQPEEPARKLEVRYAWVQPALRGDEWHQNHPLSGSGERVPQALISLSILSGKKVRSVSALPQAHPTRGSIFLTDDGIITSQPLPEIPEGEVTYRKGEKDLTVQMFSLRRVESALRDGIMLDIQFEDGTLLSPPADAFTTYETTERTRLIHTGDLSTGVLRMGISRKLSGRYVWTIRLADQSDPR